MGSVVGVYREGTDGTPLTFEPATGTRSDEVDEPSGNGAIAAVRVGPRATCCVASRA